MVSLLAGGLPNGEVQNLQPCVPAAPHGEKWRIQPSRKNQRLFLCAHFPPGNSDHRTIDVRMGFEHKLDHKLVNQGWGGREDLDKKLNFNFFLMCVQRDVGLADVWNGRPKNWLRRSRSLHEQVRFVRSKSDRLTRLTY